MNKRDEYGNKQGYWVEEQLGLIHKGYYCDDKQTGLAKAFNIVNGNLEFTRVFGDGNFLEQNSYYYDNNHFKYKTIFLGVKSFIHMEEHE